MTNFLYLFPFQIKLLFRNYKTLILGFSLPIIMFFIFSNLLSSYKVSGNIPLENLLVPAYIPIIIVNGVLVIFGQSFMIYKEQGNLLKYKLLGVSPLILSFSIFCATFIFQVIATIILIIFAYFTKGIQFPFENLLSIFLVFIIINFFQFSIAYVLTTVVSKSTTYQSLSLLLFYFQIFLGGLTFPPEMFPNFLKNIVYWTNPIIYALKIMRNIWVTNHSILDFPKELTILISSSILLLIIGTIIQKKHSNY